MGVGLAIIGTLFQTYSTIAQSRAQADALNAQARQADYEAGTLRMQSEQLNVKRQEEAKASSFRQQDLASRARQVAGQNTAALGGAGLDTSTGLGFDAGVANWSEWLSSSNKELMNLYASDRNTRQDQNNLQAQAEELTQQASMYRKQASSAKRAGMWSALGGLALNFAMMKAGGMFDKAGKGTTNAMTTKFNPATGNYEFAGYKTVNFPTRVK
jgi:hypothetical protein